MPLIGQKLDWLGVNYYTRHLTPSPPTRPGPDAATCPGPLPKTQMGWEIYPEGLHHFLTRMRATMSATCRSMSPKTAWPMPTRC